MSCHLVQTRKNVLGLCLRFHMISLTWFTENKLGRVALSRRFVLDVLATRVALSTLVLNCGRSQPFLGNSPEEGLKHRCASHGVVGTRQRVGSLVFKYRLLFVFFFSGL